MKQNNQVKITPEGIARTAISLIILVITFLISVILLVIYGKQGIPLI